MQALRYKALAKLVLPESIGVFQRWYFLQKVKISKEALTAQYSGVFCSFMRNGSCDQVEFHASYNRKVQQLGHRHAIRLNEKNALKTRAEFGVWAIGADVGFEGAVAGTKHQEAL